MTVSKRTPRRKRDSGTLAQQRNRLALALGKKPTRDTPPQIFNLQLRDPDRLLAPKPVIDVAPTTLGEDAILGAVGMVEIKLTELEEKILSEPVLEAEVLVKPTGVPYLSHPSYTRWFNRAFGRLGWAIVPRSKPMRQGSSVVVPYLLYIHQQPAAFAMGEQEFFESNKDQTWGDALEATVASALRRCAKRLGVGLELWDRVWLDDFMARHAVRVKCHGKDGKPKYQWRLKTSPKFWNEEGMKHDPDVEPAQRREEPVRSPRKAPPSAPKAASPGAKAPSGPNRPPAGTDAITEAQVKRLWVIIRNSGRDEQAIRDWLWENYRCDSTKKIKRRDYEAICEAVESTKLLPGPTSAQDREPGEEG